MIVKGTTVTLRTKLTNPDSGEAEDATGAISLKLIEPVVGEDGKPVEHPGTVEHDGDEGSGEYHADYRPQVGGLWHYEWIVEGEAVDQGDFWVEDKRPAGAVPDLTDLRVMVPRARRKIEGPWGNPGNRPPLADSQIYEMVGDAVAEVIMHSGSFFHHQLIVKTRDPLGGFPTGWKTDTELSEYEAAIITAQVALNYYFFLFRDMKISETIQNEGTQWTYSLSANVIRNYLESLRDERDKAIEGLRINMPVLDRFASNIRVRDQATVAVLEWWAGAFDSGGGLPGGQEASAVPVFFPPGQEYP